MRKKWRDSGLSVAGISVENHTHDTASPAYISRMLTAKFFGAYFFVEFMSFAAET
jgi:hypothetical protein